MTGMQKAMIEAADGFGYTSSSRRSRRDDALKKTISIGKEDRMNDSDSPSDARPETTKEKSDRLKAARLQAERDKDTRIERANRKASARRKVLGDGKS